MGEHKEALKMAMRDEFLGCFKKANAQPGDMLSLAWLYGDFLPTLSDKEHQALEEVINEMITEGVIKYVDGPKVTYALTKKGKEMIC